MKFPINFLKYSWRMIVERQKIFFVYIFLFYASSHQAFAQFTSSQVPGLPLLRYSNSQFADFNGDGKLDLMVSGCEIDENTSLMKYCQQASGVINANFGIFYNSAYIIPTLDHADYNNDGKIDFVLTGATLKPIFNTTTLLDEIVILNGADNSSKYINLYNIAGTRLGNVEWGDIDNDGDKDLLVTGSSDIAKNLISGTSLNYVNNTDFLALTYFVKNNGNNAFTIDVVNDPFPGLYFSRAKMADYDKDGDLDMFLMGNTTDTTAFTQLYINNNGKFANSNLNVFTQCGMGDCIWTDIDNDGWVDILMSGGNIGTLYTGIEWYKNNGDGTFTKNSIVTSFFEPVANSNLEAGDFNKDGYTDFIISGITPYSYLNGGTAGSTKFYINNKLGGFNSPTTINSLVTSISAGDADGDKDLDFFVSGSNNGRSAEMNISTYPGVNSAPTIPTALTSIINGNNVRLSWTPSTDALTPTMGLTYNVSLSGPVNITGESLSSGTRLISNNGNAGYNAFYDLKNLPSGTYTWKVQAIDNSYIGSAYSSTGSFTIVNQLPLPPSFFTSKLNLDPNSKILDLDIASVNSDVGTDPTIDELPDIFSWGVSNSRFSNGVFLNKGNDAFNFSIVLDKIRYLDKSVKVKMGYLDQDTKPDLFISGKDSTGAVYTQLFSNQTVSVIKDNFIFIEEGHDGIPTMVASAVTFFDYDNDGDNDIFLSGTSELGNNLSCLYENKGNYRFEETGFKLSITVNSVDYGDVDNDGDLDLLLSNNLYINNKGIFSPSTINSLIDLSAYEFKEFCDYNNDARLDIVIKDKTLKSQSSPQLLKQSANNIFTLVTLSMNTALTINSHDYFLMDLNNDGVRDIVDFIKTNGKDSLLIFNNTAPESYQNFNFSTTISANTKCKFADFDRDKKLDIVLFETDTSSLTRQNSMWLLKNMSQASNSLPGIPSFFNVNIIGDQAEFNWNKSSDVNQPDSSLTYHVMVWDSVVTVQYPYVDFLTPANTLVSFTPPSNVLNFAVDANKQTVLPLKGEIGSLCKYKVKIKKDGTYFARVYAVDNNLAISQPSSVIKFTINNFNKVSLTDPNLDNNHLSVLDWEKDGDYDLVVSGKILNKNKAIVYNNNGSLYSATDIQVQDSLPIINLNAKDLDGDNIYEFLSDSSGKYLYYKYSGSFSLSGVEHFIPNYSSIKSYWYDFDQDGDYDIVSNGLQNNKPAAYLLENKNNIFVVSTHKIKPMANVSYSVADYNSDGFQDLFVSGKDTLGNIVSLVYLRDENNLVEKVSGFEKSFNTIYNWGDYDNDGDKDLLLYGENSFGSLNKLYKNDGNGIFAEAFNAGETGIFKTGFARWYDFDNDGDLDIVGSGKNNAAIFENDNGFFEKSERLNLPFSDSNIQINFADLNSDGKNDIIYLSEIGLNIYYSKLGVVNQNPSIPTNLSSTIIDNSIVLNWNNSNDLISSGNTLGYNLFLRTATDTILNTITINSNFKMSLENPMVIGNSIKLSNLENGDYFWEVQAVDQAYRVSSFSNQASFNVSLHPSIVGKDSVCRSRIYTYNASPSNQRYQWNIEGGKILNDSAIGNSMQVRWDNLGIHHLYVTNIKYQLKDTLKIVVNDIPVSNFIFPDNLGVGAVVEFKDNSEGTITNWLWDFNENGKISSDKNPKVIFDFPGIHKVELIVKSNYGCLDTTSKEFIVSQDIFPVSIANVITPNGDLKNDYLFIENIERYPENEVWLYNSWGKEVLYKENFNNELNNGSNDVSLPAGNYVCIVELKKFNKRYEKIITVIK